MYRYRDLIAVVIIVVIIIILDIVLKNVLDNKIDLITEQLDIVDSQIIGNEEEEVSNIEELKKVSSNLVNQWKKAQKKLACYIEHDELEKIGDKLYILNTQINSKNFVDAKQGIEEIRFLIEYLEEKVKLSLENIF